jgi:hypothetical protein
MVILKCTKCDDNYYLDSTGMISKTVNSLEVNFGDTCVIRKYTDKNCIKYLLKADGC